MIFKKFKLRVLAYLGIGLVLAVLLPACGPAPVNVNEVRAYADPVTENIMVAASQNDYAKFARDLNPKMKTAINPEAFANMVALLKNTVGSYTSKEFLKAEIKGGYTVVYYKAAYTNEPAGVQVTISFEKVSDQNLVAGFYLASPKLQGQ